MATILYVLHGLFITVPVDLVACHGDTLVDARSVQRVLDFAMAGPRRLRCDSVADYESG
jgi:hypothetical protein